MARFLLSTDYITQIRSEVLDVVIEDNDDILVRAENAAIDELKSYLSQRYDTDKIFAPVLDWEYSAAYSINDRVRLTVAGVGSVLWNGTDTFADGTFVHFGTKIFFVQNSPAAATATTDDTYFVEIGTINDLFYCVADVTASTTLLNDDDFWTAGDSRSALILRFLIDVVLYEIHCRINPRNIPEHRINRRDDAIKWLKGCADPRGNMNPNLPLADQDDKHGVDISWNSNEKQSHYY